MASPARKVQRSLSIPNIWLASGVGVLQNIAWRGFQTSIAQPPPRTVSDAQVADVIKRTLETTKGCNPLVDPLHGCGNRPVAHYNPSGNAFGLQPHRAESFKLSTDPLFVDKVQNIVGLYLSPPNRAIVPCVD